MRPWLVAVLIVSSAGCGRLGFDPVPADAAPDTGARDGSTDGDAAADTGVTPDTGVPSDAGVTTFCTRPGTRAGAPDEDFAGTGVVTLTARAGQPHLAKDVYLLATGEIFVLGQLHTGASNAWTVTRLTNDGDVDTAFGAGGHAIIDIDTSNDVAAAFTVDTMGRIVAVGQSTLPGAGDERMAVTRLLADGSLDLGFGAMGFFLVNAAPIGDAEAFAGVAVDARNGIVAAGHRGMPPGATTAVAVRLTSAGVLDSSYGTGGFITSGDGTTSDTFADVLPNGDVTDFAGTFEASTARQHSVRRVDGSGQPVLSYGTGGVAITSAFGQHRTFGGDRGVDGTTTTVGWRGTGSGTPESVSLGRFLPDGSADPGFGAGGGVTTVLGGDRSRGFDVVADGRGHIIAVGDATAANNDDVLIMRYTTDGSPDPTFQGGGVVRRSFSTEDTAGNDESLRSVAIDADGRIVTVGWRRNGSFQELLVIRICGVNVD